MDPKSAAEWIKLFREQSQDKVVLVITHRYSIAQHANRICVLKGGQVVESGTHQELLTQGGEYACGWSHQQTKEE
jgi:ABC-type multidrug transport system fused ATPase/permease subunit